MRFSNDFLKLHSYTSKAMDAFENGEYGRARDMLCDLEKLSEDLDRRIGKHAAKVAQDKIERKP